MKRKLPCNELTLGLAPKTARFTLAFLPSIMGLGSLQAFSAASLLPIITWNKKKQISYKSFFCIFENKTFFFNYSWFQAKFVLFFCCVHRSQLEFRFIFIFWLMSWKILLDVNIQCCKPFFWYIYSQRRKTFPINQFQQK